MQRTLMEYKQASASSIHFTHKYHNYQGFCQTISLLLQNWLCKISYLLKHFVTKIVSDETLCNPCGAISALQFCDCDGAMCK